MDLIKRYKFNAGLKSVEDKLFNGMLIEYDTKECLKRILRSIDALEEGKCIDTLKNLLDCCKTCNNYNIECSERKCKEEVIKKIKYLIK